MRKHSLRDLDAQADIFVMGNRPKSFRDVPCYSSDMNAALLLSKASGVAFLEDAEAMCRASIIKCFGRIVD